jgi:hypothetical protein
MLSRSTVPGTAPGCVNYFKSSIARPALVKKTAHRSLSRPGGPQVVLTLLDEQLSHERVGHVFLIGCSDKAPGEFAVRAHRYLQ